MKVGRSESRALIILATLRTSSVSLVFRAESYAGHLLVLIYLDSESWPCSYPITLAMYFENLTSSTREDDTISFQESYYHAAEELPSALTNHLLFGRGYLAHGVARGERCGTGSFITHQTASFSPCERPD
jgi:hypothetical protein